MKKQFSILVILGCLSLLFTSCSSFSDKMHGAAVNAPIEPLACIVVLPASTSVGKSDTIKFSDASALEKGAALATSVMARELAGNPKVRVLTANQMSSLVPEVSGGIPGTVAALGKKLNCDGVLTTTVGRFKQREGGEYSTDSPASTNFKMVLRRASTGGVLWSADFKETQESLLSNVFSFDKAKGRGFKWISVEELLEQGVKERLAACPYLN